MNTLSASAAAPTPTPSQDPAWKVTRSAGQKAGLAATGLAGAGVATMVAPGLTMIPLAVVDLARSAAGMDTMLGMDAIQGTITMIYMAPLAVSTFISSQIILDKAGDMLGKDFWARALETPLAKKALAITDKLKSLSRPAELTAVSLTATAAASVAGLAAVSLSMPVAMATVSAGMAGMASLKQLRQARDAKMQSQSPTLPGPSKAGPAV